MSAPLLLAALHYAERGWPVFALSASKKPLANCQPCKDSHDAPSEMEACICLSCHGFYAATRDPDRIGAMFERNPRGLLAIRTGSPSGLVVVDIDVDVPDDPTQPAWTTVAALEDLGVLPDTATVITGSGGMHLLYGHPGCKITSGAQKLGIKVDIKADGAYIVAAPSVHPRTRRPYRWANSEIPDLTPLHPILTERLRERPPRPVYTGDRPATPLGRLTGLLRYVVNAPHGDRNKRLYWAACRVGDMAQAGEITEHEAVTALIEVGRSIGLSENEMIGRGDAGSIGSGIRTSRVSRR